jgi:hypothetical protein
MNKEAHQSQSSSVIPWTMDNRSKTAEVNFHLH